MFRGARLTLTHARLPPDSISLKYREVIANQKARGLTESNKVYVRHGWCFRSCPLLRPFFPANGAGAHLGRVPTPHSKTAASAKLASRLSVAYNNASAFLSSPMLCTPASSGHCPHLSF